MKLLLLVCSVSALAMVHAETAREILEAPRDFQMEMIKDNIADAVEADEGQFLYHVRPRLHTRFGAQHCSGALIGHNWILTTAHCTERATNGWVFMGNRQFAVYTEYRAFEPASIYQHPSYDPLTRANDIALLNIESVLYSTSLSPIRLPKLNSYYKTYEYSSANVTGLGLSVYGTRPLTEILNYTTTQILPNSQCLEYYDSAEMTGSDLCIQDSICHVDSGSPLVIGNELIGIASLLSNVHCILKVPARYIRITSYLGWIEATTGISYK